MSYQISMGQSEYARLRRAKAILDERDRQEEKWGVQDHSLPQWMVILVEEVGELASAISAETFPSTKTEKNWREEAIHVAAVALAMLEQYEDIDNE